MDQPRFSKLSRMTDRELEAEIHSVEGRIHELWQEDLTRLMLAHKSSMELMRANYEDDDLERLVDLMYLQGLRSILAFGAAKATE